MQSGQLSLNYYRSVLKLTISELSVQELSMLRLCRLSAQSRAEESAKQGQWLSFAIGEIKYVSVHIKVR